MTLLYGNFLSGTLSADPGSGGTTLNGSAFASLPVLSGDSMWLTLDPAGVNGAPEIVLITAHTSSATSCTVTRAQQSTTARSHPVGTAWSVAWTKADADELPFKKLTARGDVMVATSAGVAGRLAVGAANRVLRSDGTDPSWGQVQTNDIATDAVTGAKIADDAIDSEHYVDGSIDPAHLADSAVTTAKIADAAVTYAKQSTTVCRLTKTGTLSSSFTDITGWTETADAFGFYSSGADATVPSGEDGLYAISLDITSNASNSGVVEAKVFLNGVAGSTNSDGYVTVAANSRSVTSLVVYLVATDTIKVQALCDAADTARSQTVKLNIIRLS